VNSKKKVFIFRFQICPDNFQAGLALPSPTPMGLVSFNNVNTSKKLSFYKNRDFKQQFRPLIACLHDQNKSGFLEGAFNQPIRAI